MLSCLDAAWTFNNYRIFERNMSLLDLPTELILCIVGFLDYESELSALSRTTRCLYHLLEPVLYTQNLEFGDGTCLGLAAKHGRELAVRNAIQAGAKPTSATLALATIAGDEQTVRVLLDAGVDVSSPVFDLHSYPEPGETTHRLQLAADKCSHGSILPGKRYRQRMFVYYPVETPIDIPPLCAAAHHGNLAMVKMLVDAGARVNVLDMQNETPLFEAAYHGHIDIVRFLLQCGASPNFKNRKYSRPLNAAAYQNHLEVVRCLLDHGARPSLKMLRRAASRNHSAVVQLVLDHMKPRLEALSHGEQTRLACIAAACGLDYILKRLIDIGWDANSMPCPTFPLVRDHAPTARQATPLSWAAYNGHISTVRLLLSHGADPGGNPGDLVDAESVHSPLAVPLIGKHAGVEIVQMLLDAGADPDTYYDSGLLILAMQNPAILKLFLAHGAQLHEDIIEAVFKENDPALLQALLDQPDITLNEILIPIPRRRRTNTQILLLKVAQCSQPMIDLVLQHGFNPNPNTIDDLSLQYAVSDAAKHGNTTLLTLLINRGFNINHTDQQADMLENAANGRDHAAAAETVDLLIAQGMNINAIDYKGKTALLRAALYPPEEYDSNAISILLARGADPFAYVERPDPDDGILCPMLCLLHSWRNPKYRYIAALLEGIDARGDDVEFALLEEHLMYGIELAQWSDEPGYNRIEKMLRQFYWRKVDERRARGRPVICGSSVVKGEPRASKGLFVPREEDEEED